MHLLYMFQCLLGIMSIHTHFVFNFPTKIYKFIILGFVSVMCMYPLLVPLQLYENFLEVGVHNVLMSQFFNALHI